MRGRSLISVCKTFVSPALHVPSHMALVAVSAVRVFVQVGLLIGVAGSEDCRLRVYTCDRTCAICTKCRVCVEGKGSGRK